MAEGRMPQIVSERDRLGQVLIQAQRPRHGARDLLHLERMRQPRAVMCAGRRQEDLCFILQPPERLAVQDPVAVLLVAGP